jgi:hypothetical protein
MSQERIDRSAISVADLTDPSPDKEFWWSRTPDERLAALERMRRIAYDYDPVTGRIPRVLEIVEQVQG